MLLLCSLADISSNSLMKQINKMRLAEFWMAKKHVLLSVLKLGVVGELFGLVVQRGQGSGAGGPCLGLQ